MCWRNIRTKKEEKRIELLLDRLNKDRKYDPSNLIVAYEPIWAIGTGKTCEAIDANKICYLIRKLIGYDDVIIQYEDQLNLIILMK